MLMIGVRLSVVDDAEVFILFNDIHNLFLSAASLKLTHDLIDVVSL